MFEESFDSIFFRWSIFDEWDHGACGKEPEGGNVNGDSGMMSKAYRLNWGACFL